MPRKTPFKLPEFCEEIRATAFAALGPQILFKAVIDSDVCLTPSKSVAELISLSSERYPYARFLVDILESYDGIKGTGSSSIVALTTLFIRELVNDTTTEIDAASLAEMTNIVEDTYIRIMTLLAIRPPAESTSIIRKTPGENKNMWRPSAASLAVPLTSTAHHCNDGQAFKGSVQSESLSVMPTKNDSNTSTVTATATATNATSSFDDDVDWFFSDDNDNDTVGTGAIIEEISRKFESAIATTFVNHDGGYSVQDDSEPESSLDLVTRAQESGGDPSPLRCNAQRVCTDDSDAGDDEFDLEDVQWHDSRDSGYDEATPRSPAVSVVPLDPPPPPLQLHLQLLDQPPQLVGAPPPPACPVPPTYEDCTAANTATTTVTTATSAATTASASTNTTSEAIVPRLLPVVAVWEDLWLGLGLQHSFPWEWNAFEIKETATDTIITGAGGASAAAGGGAGAGESNDETVELSMPMALALAVARCVWGSRDGAVEEVEDEEEYEESINNHSKEHNNNRMSTAASTSSSARFSLWNTSFARQRSHREEDHHPTRKRRNNNKPSSPLIDGADTLTTDNILVHTISGVASHHSCALSSTVVFSASKSMFVYAADALAAHYHNTRHSSVDHEYYRNRNANKDKNKGDGSGSVLVFNRIAAVDCDYFEGEDVGASQQAKAIHHTWISGSSNGNGYQLRSLSSEKKDSYTTGGDASTLVSGLYSSHESYVQKAVNHMKTLGVRLLLCPTQPFPQKLVDTCKAAAIAVFILPRQSFVLASDLAGATVIEDLLDLTACDVGDNALGATVFDFHGSDASGAGGAGGGGVSMEMEGDVLIALSDATTSVSATPTATACSATNGSIDEKAGATDTVTASDTFSDSQPAATTTTTDSRVVSVILTSPTEPQVKALSDRFFRCLHRLRSVVEGSLVVPGAGISELMCSMELDSVVLRMERESADLYEQYLTQSTATSREADESTTGSRDFSSSHSQDPMRAQELQQTQLEAERTELESRRLATVATLLRLAQRVFVEYVRTVSFNNGATWTEASEAIERSKIGIKRLLGMGDAGCGEIHTTATAAAASLIRQSTFFEDVAPVVKTTSIPSSSSSEEPSSSSTATTTTAVRDRSSTTPSNNTDTYQHDDKGGGVGTGTVISPSSTSSSLHSKLVLGGGGRYAANDSSPLVWDAAQPQTHSSYTNLLSSSVPPTYSYHHQPTVTSPSPAVASTWREGESITERLKTLSSDSLLSLTAPVYIATDIPQETALLECSSNPSSLSVPVLDSADVKISSLQAALTAVKLLMGTGAVIETSTWIN